MAAVNDVCDFVEGLGLGQYRKKFMHHVVHGSLLLRLDDDLLRKELAIGPLVSCLCARDAPAADVDADDAATKQLCAHVAGSPVIMLRSGT